MALTPCSDLSAADWIVSSELPWQRLVGFGPAGLAAYARLRFLPDPAFDGQSESDAEADPDQSADERLRRLFEVLATHTGTPHDCYFCIWDGSGDIVDHESSVSADDVAAATYLDSHAPPGLVPEHARPRPLPGPRVNVPNRSYYLFQGTLSDARDWAVPEGWPAQPRLDITDIAFAWPADRTWCVVAVAAIALGIIEHSRGLIFGGAWVGLIASWHCALGVGGLPGWLTWVLNGGEGPALGGQLTLLGLHRPGPVLILAALPLFIVGFAGLLRSRGGDE